MIKDMHIMRNKTGQPLEETFRRTHMYMTQEGYDAEAFHLVTSSKLDFPYERVTSWTDMRQRGIPSPEDFRSSLRGTEGLNSQEYAIFCEIWHKLRFRHQADLLRVYNILG